MHIDYIVYDIKKKEDSYPREVTSNKSVHDDVDPKDSIIKDYQAEPMGSKYYRLESFKDNCHAELLKGCYIELENGNGVIFKKWCGTRVQILIVDSTSPAGFSGSSISIRTRIKIPKKLELQLEKPRNPESPILFEINCKMSENYYTIRSLKDSLKVSLKGSPVEFETGDRGTFKGWCGTVVTILVNDSTSPAGSIKKNVGINRRVRIPEQLASQLETSNM